MGDILRGNTSLSKIYRGQTELSKVYRGQTEIWTSAAFPPVGDYITDNLTYYYDFGEPTSYDGVSTTITNIAPAGTKRGDAVIYAGTLDLGSQTTSGTTYDPVKRTLQMGGSGGAWDQYTTDQTWFGDITDADTDAWGSDITAEFGYYYQPHAWTGQDARAVYMSQRNAGPGQNMESLGVGVFTVAGYSWPGGFIDNTVGQAYILTISWSGTTAKRYLNGVFVDQVTTTALRRDANGSPTAWGCLYTQESGNDRLGGPTWSEYQYVRFYEDKALSDAEVLQNYNANKARLGLT